MEFLADYGLFLAKTATLTIAILLVFGTLISLRARSKSKDNGTVNIDNINHRYQNTEDTMNKEILSKDELKQRAKEKKKTSKEEKLKLKSSKKTKKDKSETTDSRKKRIFILFFDGDMRASEVEFLREEITAILMVATPQDEVVITIESGGGMVHPYGLAASQLQRLKDHNIPLTAAVDLVAASGGYLMACVADRIIAAPFAVIGSIGVLAQVPNFHRLLKKYNIDFEQITAGEYKRTLTLFGKNTDKAREKLQEDIEDIHQLFKDYVVEHRPNIDIEQVATGEHWFGKRALEKGLVDELIASDDYLLQQRDSADIYEVEYTRTESIKEQISSYMHTLCRQLFSY